MTSHKFADSHTCTNIKRKDFVWLIKKRIINVFYFASLPVFPKWNLPQRVYIDAMC